jgi:hypothetical protein
MRIASALMGLLYSVVATGAATPAKWCSDSYGYDKPAELIVPSEGAEVLRVSGKVVNLFDEYAPTGSDFIYATIDYASQGIEKKQRILIFRDRVFWPCDQK